jgi:hypothetical protein
MKTEFHRASMAQRPQRRGNQRRRRQEAWEIQSPCTGVTFRV